MRLHWSGLKKDEQTLSVKKGGQLVQFMTKLLIIIKGECVCY